MIIFNHHVDVALICAQTSCQCGFGSCQLWGTSCTYMGRLTPSCVHMRCQTNWIGTGYVNTLMPFLLSLVFMLQGACFTILSASNSHFLPPSLSRARSLFLFHSQCYSDPTHTLRNYFHENDYVSPRISGGENSTDSTFYKIHPKIKEYKHGVVQPGLLTLEKHFHLLSVSFCCNGVL